MISVNKIALLIPYQNMFIAGQINNLAEAITPGSPFIIKPRKKQSGRFLGRLLESINFPLLLKASASNGIQDCSRYQPPLPLPPPKSDNSGI